MRSTAPARTTLRRAPVRKARLAGVLVVLVAIVLILRDPLPESWPSASPSAAATSIVATVLADHGESDRGAGARGLGPADGAVPDGTSVFDDGVPGVAHLDPDLLRALRRAGTDAAASGLELGVQSGWRSPAYQAQLLRDATRKHGSAAEAARWVATPERSAHVSGDAVDVGPPSAAAWLAERGAAYGLCRVYDNEPWHFEHRPDAATTGCPPTYADPTQDPRLHR